MNGVGTKAIAGAGATPLAIALVEIFLWATGLQPPDSIKVHIEEIVAAAAAYGAVFWTPHNPAPPVPGP